MIVLVRPPTEALARCALTFVEREPIDIARAQRQHHAFMDALREADANIIELDVLPNWPDAVFVEDMALVVDEVAVMTRPTASRAGEAASVEVVLRSHREVVQLNAGSLEGGDILRIGKRIYVGRSQRTDADGISALRECLEPFGYSVDAVDVDGCLHLKTGCTYLGSDALLCNSAWVDAEAIDVGRHIEVVEDLGANTMVIGNQVLMSASVPRTAARVRDHGYNVRTLEIDEIEKAEAGLTCMAIRLG